MSAEPVEDLRERIADLEDEVRYLERKLADVEEDRDELQRDLDERSQQDEESMIALREWLDRRTGELKWTAHKGGNSAHLRDLAGVLDVLNGAYAHTRLPL